MKKANFIKLSLFIFALLAFSSYNFSQAGRGVGRLHGVVVDEEENPIQSAKIVINFLQNEEIKRETTTNKNGEWSIMALGTGMWRVTASAEGYMSAYTDTYIRQLARNPKVTITLKKTEEAESAVLKDEASLNLLEEANQLFSEKKYDEALAVYRQFFEENPNAYQIRLSIGDCYREKKEYDQALEEYNKTLEKAAEDEIMGKEITAKALASIGQCYLDKDDLESAQNYFKKSIETYPENEILAYNVGEIYFSNQKIDEAIHYFELSSQIKPEWSAPYLKLGYVYLNKGDFEKSLEYFQKFIDLDPENPEAPKVESIIATIEKMKK